MTRTDQIRRRADGSIDTAHYMSEGRIRRSEAARDMLAGADRPRRLPALSAVAAGVFGLGFL